MRRHGRLNLKLALLILTIVISSVIISTSLSCTIRTTLMTDPTDLKAIILGYMLRDIFMPGVTVLAALLIITPIAKRVVHPITSVSDAARRIAEGDFSTRVPVRKGHRDELSEMARNFNLMAEELERNQMLKKDFAATISHQFKTPLAIISGYSRLLEEDDLSDEDRRKYAALITRESGRLVKLSSDILRLSRLDGQEILASPTGFLLDEQILQAIVRLEPKWTKKNIEFDIDLPETYYYGDEELLSQVWFNLADNAVKYTSDGGIISVDITRSDGWLTVTFSDNGEGMDEETRSHAFQRYYQGSGASDGSGLGLAIVARIAQLHGGSAEIESAPAQGCTVKIRLPERTFAINAENQDTSAY